MAESTETGNEIVPFTSETQIALPSTGDGSLVAPTQSEDSLSSSENRTNGSVMSTTSTGTRNDIDAEVANFLKEIDEVVATEPSSEVQTELPVKYGDWQQCIDEKTQHMYYWNTVTDEVTWLLPEEVSNHLARQSKESGDASVNATTTTSEVEVDTLQEKKIDSKSQVSSDHSSINTDLDIDAELERAVEEKDGSGTCFKVEPHLEKALGDSPTDEVKGDGESDLATSDAGAHGDGLANENSSSSGKNSDNEEEATITEISQTLFGKLKFLGISNVTLTNFHFLLIQIETRISDWKEKALSTSFVLKKLQEADHQLKAYEESATPSGWSCHWDSSAARYFYMNDETQKMQWQYPETSGSDNTKTGADGGNKDDSDDDIPPKKSRKENLEQSPLALPKGDSTPPLPAAPVEKPPLPPPQPEKPEEVEGEGDSDNPDNDDGIMMEISDGEKEEDTERQQSMAASAVTSQQPVLYKGPTINYDVSSPLNYQTYQAMLQQTMPTSQTTHTAISDARTVLAKTKRKKTKKSSSVPKKTPKGISSMVAQWQKAKNEIELEDRMLEEEEDDDEEPDREELGQQHFERWKQEQIASGRAFANANFEPVPEDWRTRMMQKKKKKKKV